MSTKQAMQHTEFTLWHEYDVSFRDKVIYIGSHSEDEDGESGVDFQMAERVIKNLHFLDRELHDNGITIKMNNPGGCSVHGLAIYDAIETCTNHITAIGYGHIMSMGAIIFQAADTRIMAPHSRMMLHKGSAGFADSMDNFYANVEEFKKLDEMLYSILLKRIKEKKPRFKKSQLEAKMSSDWYIGPKEAIELGLCDKVLE